MKKKMPLTHLNDRGEAHMVDVSNKEESARMAIASGQLITRANTLTLVADNLTIKGDVLATARIAGIMAAKKTADLIPLCHQLPLSKVSIEISADPALPGFQIKAQVSVNARTGVEMEALTAVATTCLTLYDMLKAHDKTMAISNIRLLKKHGGRSGSFVAKM